MQSNNGAAFSDLFPWPWGKKGKEGPLATPSGTPNSFHINDSSLVHGHILPTSLGTKHLFFYAMILTEMVSLSFFFFFKLFFTQPQWTNVKVISLKFYLKPVHKIQSRKPNNFLEQREGE